MGIFDKIKEMLSCSTTLPEGSCGCSGEGPAHEQKPEETSCCSDGGIGDKHEHKEDGCCGDDEGDLTKPSGGCGCS